MQAHHEMADQSGWSGPWELTTCTTLIEEEFVDPLLPSVPLGPVPREKGAKRSSLHYQATGLDVHSSSGLTSTEKNTFYLVTPEKDYRGGIFQLPGSWITRAPEPSFPDQTIRVADQFSPSWFLS